MTEDDFKNAVATLELENKFMRQRMDRLEDQNRQLEEELFVAQRQLELTRESK
jgi:hypothetical protein